MTIQSIGIAGAGIIGRLVALELRQQGHQVTIFEKDPIASAPSLCELVATKQSLPNLTTSACSYSAAGMLTPYSEADTAEPLVTQLGLASLDLWPDIVKQLGSQVGYRTGGTLVLAHSQDRADFDRFHNLLEANILPTDEQVTPIKQAQLPDLEPQLGPRFSQALHMPKEAWLCACCTMAALFKTLIAEGVCWQSSAVVEEVKPRAIIVKSAAGLHSHSFDWVIDSRGLGAIKQQPTLRGVRGEILWLRAPEVKINRLIRLMHPRYRIYIVPRRKDLYLIGATQIESEDPGPISVRSTLELLSAAFSIHSGFGEAQIVYSDVNLRPALPNNQPQIKFKPGLLSINGLFRHGYLVSPAIAKEVARMISEKDHYQSPYRDLSQYQSIDEAIA